MDTHISGSTSRKWKGFWLSAALLLFCMLNCTAQTFAECQQQALSLPEKDRQQSMHLCMLARGYQLHGERVGCPTDYTISHHFANEYMPLTVDCY